MPETRPATPYQAHAARWAGGCGSDCCGAANKVFCRGTLPCDILFVGEAPGASEDVLGRPFVGPAGKLLDYCVMRAVPEKYRTAYTNVVACIPRDAEGTKATAPDWGQIEACRPRLEEFIALAAPALIFAVGKVAAECLEPCYRHSTKLPARPGTGEPAPVVVLQHPAAILRANQAQQGLLLQRMVVTIAVGVTDHLGD